MKGQVILILLLVMTVGLAVGLSIIQRSLSDVSTASRIEQSSRAFSAAEAGIERALKGNCTAGNCVSFENNAEAVIQDSGYVPAVVTSGQQVALEYPPISKETFAQFWLVDPNSPSNPTTSIYTGSPVNNVDFYWGVMPQDSNQSNWPAIEVTIIYYNGVTYLNRKYFCDPNSARITQNGFTCPNTIATPLNISSTTGNNRSFAYSARIPIQPNTIVIRSRLLYSPSNHPLAMRAVGTCGSACSIPPQARIILASGTAGDTQRNIQFFSLDKVLPPYLDFAIFSAGAITK